MFGAIWLMMAYSVAIPGMGSLEVADVFLHVAFVLALVAFLESGFQMAQVFGTGTVVFGFGKSELACALYLAENG